MSCNCGCEAVGYDVTKGDVENSNCIGEGKMDGVVGCRDGCCDIVRCPVPGSVCTSLSSLVLAQIVCKICFGIVCCLSFM